MSGDLTDRLRAALDEAEKIARAAAGKAPAPWAAVSESWEKDAAYLKDVNGGHEGESCGCCSAGTLSPEVAAHASANGPDVVLRTIQAHREILTLASDAESRRLYYERDGEEPFAGEARGHAEALGRVIRSIAAIYLSDEVAR